MLELLDPFVSLVNVHDPLFHHALLVIVLLPLTWNILGRAEYNYKVLRTLGCGSKRVASYLLTAYIVSLSWYRNSVVEAVTRSQPKVALLPPIALGNLAAEDLHYYLGSLIMIVGQALVLPSMWKLGIVGTYLGDYCGIYLPERVSGYPFNVLDNPMYMGTTITFIGGAVTRQSPAGLLLAAIIYVCYMIAIAFEEPFTHMIYVKKAEEEAKQAAEKQK
jgi:methylene-fatty-acyl-phospholipid synthase